MELESRLDGHVDFRFFVQSQKAMLNRFKCFLDSQLVHRIKEQIKLGDVFLFRIYLQFRDLQLNLREFLNELFLYFSKKDEFLTERQLSRHDLEVLKRAETKKQFSQAEFSKTTKLLFSAPFEKRQRVLFNLMQIEDPELQNCFQNSLKNKK